MRSDLFIPFLFVAFAIFFVIILEIEIKIQFIAKTRCKLGLHYRKTREKGQVVYRYRCMQCNKPKDHPHLKIINGSKKFFENKFKW